MKGERDLLQERETSNKISSSKKDSESRRVKKSSMKSMPNGIILLIAVTRADWTEERMLQSMMTTDGWGRREIS